MADLCTDNRFELIEKYKRMLIDATNIETCAEEMAVLGDIMHRIWQMGWLEKLEQTSAQRWIPCSEHLPKDSMRKQVQLDNGWIITAYFEEEQWYSIPEIYDRQDDLYISLEEAGHNVLAWMPLPNPHKGKS